jgi:hypothetical protein
VTPRRLTVIATGPSGPPEELDPLRQAGHEVVVGRPLDMRDRRAYGEADLIEQCRVADVVLASYLERRANLALALQQILAVGRGEPPAHVINPEAIANWRMVGR